MFEFLLLRALRCRGLHPQLLQDIRLFLIGSQQVMAYGAVLGDGLAFGAGVLFVVATETAVKIHVPDVVGIGTPGDLHRGKNVALKDGEQLLGSASYVITMLAIQ